MAGLLSAAYWSDGRRCEAQFQQPCSTEGCVAKTPRQLTLTTQRSGAEILSALAWVASMADTIPDAVFQQLGDAKPEHVRQALRDYGCHIVLLLAQVDFVDSQSRAITAQQASDPNTYQYDHGYRYNSGKTQAVVDNAITRFRNAPALLQPAIVGNLIRAFARQNLALVQARTRLLASGGAASAPPPTSASTPDTALTSWLEGEPSNRYINPLLFSLRPVMRNGRQYVVAWVDPDFRRAGQYSEDLFRAVDVLAPIVGQFHDFADTWQRWTCGDCRA